MIFSIATLSINDTQHNDIQHNDIQYNDTRIITLTNNTQYNDIQHYDIQHNDTQHCNAERQLCGVPFILSVTYKPLMLSVITLRVIMLSVVAPL
jgi:hypothetical protein